MPVHVLMPQMGESITEGTIVRWFKTEGEQVRKDEPLLEISTDKVDAEVPSPASGVLSRIEHGPGETVAVETVIGTIAGEGEAVAPAPSPRPSAAAAAPAAARAAAAPPDELFELEEEPRSDEPVVHIEVAAPPRPAHAGEASGEAEALRKRSSPLVRRIAAEHGIDLARIEGTGISGRVTKADIEAYMERGKAAAAPPAPARRAPTEPPEATKAPAGGPQSAPPPPPPGPSPSRPFEGDELREQLSVMRQRIAEHMVASKRTSPHVYTLFEVDVTRVLALRNRHKDEFERQHGIKLTVTPFFLKAAVESLKAFPVVNASLDGSEIVFHRHINLGVAVAVPSGLIVPVVKHAEELSIIGLQRAVTDVATRARSKRLMPEEVHGATFSVTNPGQFGGLVGLPIINQPNVAILSIGNVQRRPLVVTDDEGGEAIAIRDAVFLTLSFDHRLIDGAIADQFMADLKANLESGRFELG
jgi:pyruvate dehydrogenase E2 component (dihydrolipoamide acetyltransferase)